LKRTVFLISDRTGITAEIVANSLLTQFEGVEFEVVRIPFVDTMDKARDVVVRINRNAEDNGTQPLVFSTLVQEEIRDCVETSKAFTLDMFHTFIKPLEDELGVRSSHITGKSHGVGLDESHKDRIDAVNYALRNDDGISTKYYPDADVILVGVSRTGKTPTCLYLALQFGVHAANYPLTEEDLQSEQLPRELRPWRRKLFGLTTSPDRLCQIRNERRPDSSYASMAQCNFEVNMVNAIFAREKIPSVNTSFISVEEIATTIMDELGLERRWFGHSI
jgi:regulator of PEP synthase PpsR (kinase-PPPase family)